MKKTRNWQEMELDEIAAIWQQYLYSDFGGYDVLRQSCIQRKRDIKLSPMDIHRLVDDLLDRLNPIKEEI